MERSREILNYFYLLKRNRRLSTSYLFVGDNFSLVEDILKLLICRKEDGSCGRCWDCQMLQRHNHPDLFVIQPDPSTIRIESIREGQRFLSLKGFRSKKKILLIKGGENFGSEAANAFLKTLEEPPGNSFIALLSSKLEGMLPTIISRCHKIFLPYREGSLPSSSPAANFLKGAAVRFKERREFTLFLQTLIAAFRNQLIYGITEEKKPPDAGGRIISKPYTSLELINILDVLLKIYRARKSINENLALNLIKIQL